MVGPHVDGWANFLTGIGDRNRDKTYFTEFRLEVVREEEAEIIWRGDDMAAKIVEQPVADMLRQGFSIKVDEGEGKAIEVAVKAALKRLGAMRAIRRIFEYRRAYGGGAILLGAKDGAMSMSEPLNEANIASMEWLTVLRPRELWPWRWYSDPREPKYGMPRTYTLQPEVISGYVSNDLTSGIEIHESRLIVVRGTEISRRQVSENNGWGDSVFTRIARVLSQFNQTWGGGAVLLSDFSQAVMKIKGLAELLQGNKKEAIRERAIAVDMARSVARMVICDSDEDFERKATPLTGYAEMLDKFALRLAAAANMPGSKLFGQAPAGLNATGDSDIRWYYDFISAEQEDYLRPALEQLLRVVFASRSGPTAGQAPSNWALEFATLWQASLKEQAEAHKLQADADAIYLQFDVTTPEEVAKSRFGEQYSIDTTVDLEARQTVLQAQPVAADKGPEVTITPTDLAAIVTVNQALIKAGYPSRLPGDPDGGLTVLQFKAKNENLQAAAATAAAAGDNNAAPTAPAAPTASA